MKKIAFNLLIIIQSISSCNAQTESSSFKVQISDEFVAETVRQYIIENKIDIKKKIITIRAEVGTKKVFEITDYFSALYKESRFTPTYYAILDNSIVVLVFTRVEQTFKRDHTQIIKEIDKVLEIYKIVLSKEIHLNYNAPVWSVVEQCDGEYEVNKNVTPFRFESIPCGYSIVRDSVKLDSLMLIKK